MLAPGAVLVFVGREVQLVPQEPAGLHSGQRRRHWVAPLRNKDDEGQWLGRPIQQFLMETRTNKSRTGPDPARSGPALTSKCVTMASISSSQNGGLASNEPLTGLKDRNGLKHTQRQRRPDKPRPHHLAR